MMLACKKCQAKLVAFIHHELTPTQRRQVALHLDSCETCYAIYVQQQDLAQNLAQMLPHIGQGQQAQYDRVWAAVQQNIVQPRRSTTPYPARYGFAVLAFTLMLLIPLTLGNQNLPLVVPTPPAPLLLQATPSSTDQAESALSSLPISLTPNAKTSKTVGPSPDAISTP
jgi:Putative zinc-finger